jgi:hypothetical protein
MDIALSVFDAPPNLTLDPFPVFLQNVSLRRGISTSGGMAHGGRDPYDEARPHFNHFASQAATSR